jgi:hypothetical protein
MPDGSYLLNQDIIDMLNIPKAFITESVNIEKKRNRAQISELQRK